MRELISIIFGSEDYVMVWSFENYIYVLDVEGYLLKCFFSFFIYFLLLVRVIVFYLLIEYILIFLGEYYDNVLNIEIFIKDGECVCNFCMEIGKICYVLGIIVIMDGCIVVLCII